MGMDVVERGTRAHERQRGRVNGIGDFNLRGTSRGGDHEFVRGKNGIYLRRRPQTTKDRNAIAGAGGDANSTHAPSPAKAKEGAAGEAKAAGLGKDSRRAPEFEKTAEVVYKHEWQLFEDKEHWSNKEETETSESEGKILAAEGGGEFEAKLDKEGVEMKLGATVSATLFEGKLVWKTLPWKLDWWNEDVQIQGGAALSSGIAAKAEGDVALKAGKKGAGFHLGAEGKAEAFAGIRSGFELFGKLAWKPRGESEYVDVVEAKVGGEAWAGAAAAAGFKASLFPRIAASLYYGAALGLGGSGKASVEIGAIPAARLGYILASRGVEQASAGLEKYGPQVAKWLASSAVQGYEDALWVVSEFLDDDDRARMVKPEVHGRMTAKGRASLIDRMLAGVALDDDEDAILAILRTSGDKGDIERVVSLVDGGADRILSKLDGQQDGAARAIFSRWGVSH